MFHSLPGSKGYSFLCVGGMELTGKKQNIDPTWNILMKDVDQGEPTSFQTTYYIWVALKENVREASIIMWIITEVCSNQGLLPGLLKN